MAKLIALEWDAHEARVAVGTPRGSDVVVEQAFAVELSAGTEGETPTAAEVAVQLAAELSERGLTGNEALVAVPRSGVELRSLSLPQAPPEEIPDLVRFQAMQAFTTIGEDWPLDYVELESHEESMNVLAAVVSPQVVSQTKDVCLASELKERCLVLRPFAAVSLLHRFESIDVYRSSLIVDLLPAGADVTAISDGHVVFMRSVRLPVHADRKAQSIALVGELRRTIGAAQNQMGGSRIEQIVICGQESENSALCESVSSALSLDVITFDPFEAVRPARQLKRQLPEHAGRYAPLLGMLACHTTGTGHTLDFLNPRKRPAPPSRTGRNLVIAAVALVIGVVGTFFFLSQKSALDEEIASLVDQSAEMDLAVQKARKLTAEADRIGKFADGDVTWLDEIRRIARRMPDAEHVILDDVNISIDPVKGGRVTLQGNVVSTDVIANLEESLRYGENRVQGYKSTVDYTNREYPYQFKTVIVVPPDQLENGHSVGRPPIDEPEEGAAAESGQPVDASAVEQEAETLVDTQKDTPTSDEEDASTLGESETPAAASEERTEEATEADDQSNDEPATEESGSEIS
jgi:Tfp pilus assembly PilM family ATPase